jgi:hypothetical protein
MVNGARSGRPGSSRGVEPAGESEALFGTSDGFGDRFGIAAVQFPAGGVR